MRATSKSAGRPTEFRMALSSVYRYLPITTLVWYPVQMHDERDIKPCFRAVVKRLNKRAGPIQNLVEIGKVSCLELGVDGLPVDRDFKRPAARGNKHELGNRLLEGQ